MARPLARYYGIPEYADEFISRLHVIPAKCRSSARMRQRSL
jgi:hypothetical protein